MIQAMFSAVSGVQAHQTRLDVIGNNIANVNTVAYKAGRTTFADQLSQTYRGANAPQAEGRGGLNPTQVGLGVRVGSITTLQTQGSLQQTGRPSDIALQGNGFFLVGDGASTAYTRDGAFTLDANGSLVSATTGMKLLGWPAGASGAVDSSQPITAASSIQIPIGTLTSVKATENVAFAGNLNSSAAIGASYTRTAQVFDSLGNPHNINFNFSGPTQIATAGNLDSAAAVGATTTQTFKVTDQNNTVHTVNVAYVKTAADTWGFTITSPTMTFTGGASGTLNFTGAALTSTTPATLPALTGSGLSLPLGFAGMTQNAAASSPTLASSMVNNWTFLASSASGNVTPSTATAISFDANGKLATAIPSVSLALANGSTAPLTVKPDMTRITQLAGEYTANVVSQDGFPMGTLQSYSIGDDGTVTGIFSNGLNRSLAQVAVAQFSNPAGLDKVGSNMFRPSTNSGTAQVNAPGASGAGSLSSGFLEQSNVNLADEFTGMIVTQRGFQANTRIVTASDEILQDVIQMKR